MIKYIPKKKLFFLPLLLTLSLSTGCIISIGPSFSIGEARQQPVGSTVTAGGIVTVPTGTFNNGFAIQDYSAGIYIATSNDHHLKIGTTVTVQGKLIKKHGLLQIQPSHIKIDGSSPPVQPKAVATESVGEATEGRLVQVVGHVQSQIIDDLPYGWKFYINDGSGKLLIFIGRASDIDISKIQSGQKVHVTGFSSQYDDHDELLPRFQGDITIIGK